MLWLSLHFPELPLVVFPQADTATTACVVSEGHGRQSRVFACNERARRGGVSTGMAIGAAHALLDTLQVRARDPAVESATLAGLANWALRYTSVVSLAPPHCLLLEIGGSLALFGGIEALLERLADGLRRQGLEALPAVAPTPAGALLLARAGRAVTLTEQVSLSRAVAELPVSALVQDTQRLSALTGMGLHRIRDCLRLPREGLNRRLGTELLAELDRALGLVPDPRPRYTPPSRFHRRLPLPVETTCSEPLLFAFQRLLLELDGVLRARCAGVQALQLRLFHARGRAAEGGQAYAELCLATREVSRGSRGMMGLLRERLSRLQLTEPVDAVALRVDAFVPLASPPQDFFADEPGSESENTLLDRLCARLGKSAVRGLSEQAGHRPEKGWSPCPVGEGRSAATRPPGRRPLWLLPRPRPLAVRQGRPCWQGPLNLGAERERIESGWWEGADVVRDYFVARNPQGSRLWVYREQGRWFLHGIFD